MKPSLTLWTLLICVGCNEVLAGHGFTNNFEDIEWLPTPGRTPNQFGYALDVWEEQAQLAMLGTRTARFGRSLNFAREKLAEIEAMVKLDLAIAIDPAMHAYENYLAIAKQSIAHGTSDKSQQLAQRLAIALLEHQYMLSINYLELPRRSRPKILDIIATAARHYEQLVPLLGTAFKASLFFKEEEVRWSTELARQADAQGL